MKTLILALAIAATAGLAAPTGLQAQDAGTETVVVPETPPEDTVTGDESAAGGFTVLRGDVDLSGFMWLARPLVIFADTPDDPRYAEQLRLLALRPADLAARDVVIIADTDPSMRINAEEVFGPVASTVRVKDYEEALAVANGTEFGLSSGIVTTSLKHAQDFQRRVRAGMVMVNLPTAGVDYHVPFGGSKKSSFGPREQGFGAIDFYTQTKTAYSWA